eukprot:CAMPEP_0197240496 /NCGR_PEP_ID=MMETSP1429-20130617/6769_1 /TAXON_ID=49237 /ORGANISM="Chaetoceros  sp., Strain UNC1202" /LENGTH=204 /DNA_ID=CAMNT_0042700145 /DNA_START=104 /DNA_END=718 /DNA_ORIENTATION=+
MENIQTLMKKDRLDAIVLGMESLSHLTKTSNEAASAVIMGEEWQEVKDTLFSLIMDHDYETSDSDDVPKEEHLQLTLALTIVANALGLYCRRKEEVHAPSELTLDVEELKEIIVSLSGHMKKAESESAVNNSNVHVHTQNMYQASRCVMFLIELSEELKSFVAESTNLGLLAFSLRCEHGGICKHNLLGNVCRRIASSLGTFKC